MSAQAHAPRFAAARDGEAQDAAPDDAEDSSAPADEEGGAKLISAENSSSTFPVFTPHGRLYIDRALTSVP